MLYQITQCSSIFIEIAYFCLQYNLDDTAAFAFVAAYTNKVINRVLPFSF